MDIALAVYNPCLNCTVNGNITCRGQALSISRKRDVNTLCCGDDEFNSAKPGENKCRYHSEKGCTVKSLGCKVWLCEEAWDHIMSSNLRFREFVKVREHVIQQIRLYSIPCKPRASKKDNFKSS